MKSNSSSDISPDEALVHSALQEFARNGKGADTELVDSILMATVERKTIVPTPPPSLNWRTWTVGVGSVAALLLLLIGVLSSFPYRSSERAHSEIQFSVTFTPDEAKTSDSAAAASRTTRPGTRYRGEVDVIVASPGSLSPIPEGAKAATLDAEWTYPIPVMLASEDSVSREERIEIDSDSVSQESQHLVYSGNVRLRYRSFLISAEEIRLRTDPSEANTAFLTAENASFSSKSKPDFPVTAAQAGQLEIDPVSGLIRLHEVALLETLENGKISIVDTQAVSITAAGYAIESRSLRR